MKDKFIDFTFPIAGGAGGGLLSIITTDGVIQTAVSALIFAFVGGIVGFLVKKVLDKIFKKKK